MISIVFSSWQSNTIKWKCFISKQMEWFESQSTCFETQQIILEYLPKKAKIQISIETPTQRL